MRTLFVAIALILCAVTCTTAWADDPIGYDDSVSVNINQNHYEDPNAVNINQNH